MTPEEVRFLWSLLPGFGVGAVVAAAVAWMLFKHLLPGYLVRKGQNLADKEDIADLTNKVEEVKRQHVELLEALKYRNQLRMAAIDRRLQAHQDGFTLLRELVQHIHGDKLHEMVSRCQTWWEKNCLYLEPEARNAFSNAYFAASVHKTLLHAMQWQPPSADDAQKRIDDVATNWARVTSALNVMLEAVALPPLTGSEVNAMLGTDPS